MAVKKEKRNNITMKIKGALSLVEAEKIRKSLVKKIKNHKETVLDLSAVLECDTAGIQLLCSARMTADQLKKRLLIIKAGKKVIETFKKIGLDPYNVLNLEEEVSNG